MPAPLLALAAYAPAIIKGVTGLIQAGKHVDRVDTTTPEEREILASARQAQAGGLPGLAQYQQRLAQTQNATIQNAALGAGSASDFLAASGAADATRQQGEQQLSLQQQAYGDRATQRLNAVLSAMAGHSRADTDRAAQANATLKGAALNNLSNAVTEGATVAAYQGTGGFKSNTPSNPFDASQVNGLLFAGPSNTAAAEAAGYRPRTAYDSLYHRRTGPYAGYIG